MMKKISVLLLIISMLFCLGACGDGFVLEEESDLAALNIGVVSSTYGEIYAKGTGSENLFSYPAMDDAAEALISGEIDCIITDYNTAKSIASASDEITTTDTRIIEDTDFYAAVRTADFDTLAVAEVVTAELDKETDFSKLCRGFVENTGEERDAFITEDQIGSSGTFTLGVIADTPPYAYETSDGSLAGISVEYAKRFAEKRDQTLEIKVYSNKTALSNALKTGEIDVFFREAPLPATPGVSYSTVCYTAELRILIADK